MRSRQRKTLILALEILAVLLIVVDMGIWIGVARPYEDNLQTEKILLRNAAYQKAQAEVRVARLEKFQGGDADVALAGFLEQHMPARRSSFSKAAGLVRKLTEESGVQLSGVSYRLTRGKNEPLARLAVDVNVHGPFNNLMDFAHALETTREFVLLRGFTLEGGDGGSLALRTSAELYVTP